jgi:hypothetical protein
MSENQDVATEATEQATPVEPTETVDTPAVQEPQSDPIPELADGLTRIVDEEDPRITYHGEAAKAVDFTPDANAVAIKVFPDGQVITEF